jgi:hypothetical protein
MKWKSDLIAVQYTINHDIDAIIAFIKNGAGMGIEWPVIKYLFNGNRTRFITSLADYHKKAATA